MSRFVELDREFFARNLNDFIPDRVYDVHAHLYRSSFWEEGIPDGYPSEPADVTLEAYREQMQIILPEREVHGMHFPLAFVEDTAPGNEWISQEIAKDALARGQFLVKPTDDPEWVRQEVRRLGLRGLKPFSTYSPVGNCWEAEIPDYLPEPLVTIADQEGWTITLHMMRYDGIGDASNQYWIRRYCEKYPNMQLILDHCARGFSPYQVIEGLPNLSGLDNLWADTSVACHPLAVEAVLRILGPRRVMYGSDHCLSHVRGTNLPVGSTFMWLNDGMPIWDSVGHTTSVRPTLVGLENLRAIKAACWALQLSDEQVENFFWGNAADLLGLAP